LRILFFLLFFLCHRVSIASIDFDADKIDSIQHFRAIPIYLENNEINEYVRHSTQDSKGYLWTSGGEGLMRYDGYQVEQIGFEDNSGVAGVGYPPFLFSDSKQQLWVSFLKLYRLNESGDEFDMYDISNSRFISAIGEGTTGDLWLAGHDFGLIKFSPDNENSSEIDLRALNSEFPNLTHSIAVHKAQNAIWLVTANGIFRFDANDNILTKVDTPLDEFFGNFVIRDISLDETSNVLWVATPRGLLKIDTLTKQAMVYTNESEKYGLSTSHITTTLLDSAGNLWVGLEKEGLCVYRNSLDDFLCLQARFNEENKIPTASIEDINEDQFGSLWITLSHSGVYRVTPKLEKFKKLKDIIVGDQDAYFPHNFDGVQTDDGKLWFASDGGGINIFEPATRKFESLRHAPNDPFSLPSDSVISLTKDEKGKVWAGMWNGGLAQIDPITQVVTSYPHNPDAPENETIAGDNVFVVESDQLGGIWLTLWNKGIQHFDTKTQKFTSYLHVKAGGNSTIKNKQISHIQIHDGFVWMSGEVGLEKLNVDTGEITLALETETDGFTFVLVESEEEIWLGSRDGLVLFNSVTNQVEEYTSQHGLAANLINFLYKDEQDNLWLATNNGLSILDIENKTVQSYYKRDGLVDNVFSAHGEFLVADDLIYIPTRLGISIIDPNFLATDDTIPATVISSLELIESDELGNSSRANLANEALIQLPFSDNSVKFSFTGLSFVSPQYNKFKYRLVGWQKNFIQTSASERSVRYTNLPVGKYRFEVFSASSSGNWDPMGDSVTFAVLAPWYRTWWALLLWFLLGVLSLYCAFRFRLKVQIQREMYLTSVVEEKTKQIQQYADEVKLSSDALQSLNLELEDRVKKRTSQMQAEMDERKSAESKLYHMAFHDSLTGLANRPSMMQKLSSLLLACKTDKTLSFGIVYLDGDRFKQVNDTLGHQVGDELLVAVAKRLESHFRNERVELARLGGDEFTIIIESNDTKVSIDYLESKARDIIKAFQVPFTLGNHELYFNISAGILICDHNYDSVADILRDVDIAMYKAKEDGRGRYRIFDNDIKIEMQQSAKLESDLRKAIENNDFHLVYQPIVDLRSGTIAGFEALVRWQHHEHGIISPFHFIPVAEETGLIWELGQWVLAEACRQGAQWHANRKGMRPFMSVNLSTKQLQNPKFITELDVILKNTMFASNYLKLELTESVVIEDGDTINSAFNQLGARHIDLAIDDFGTGYSSLSYLTNLPVQFLKVDRTFIKDIDQNTDSQPDHSAQQIIKATISLAKGLGKGVVAEGIETNTQLRTLIEYECDFVQGYLLSKPVGAKEAENLMNAKHSTTIPGQLIDISKFKLQ
jgi:diguanylate cyclase (GGDEF)-like protein